MPLVEQELPTLPEHMSSSPVFSWVHVTRSLVICVCFVDRCLSFYPFVLSWCCLSFDLRILITLWYLQALLSCPDIPSNGGGRTASHPRRLGVPMLFIEIRVDQSFVYCVIVCLFVANPFGTCIDYTSICNFWFPNNDYHYLWK